MLCVYDIYEFQIPNSISVNFNKCSVFRHIHIRADGAQLSAMMMSLSSQFSGTASWDCGDERKYLRRKNRILMPPIKWLRRTPVKPHHQVKTPWPSVVESFRLREVESNQKLFLIILRKCGAKKIIIIPLTPIFTLAYPMMASTGKLCLWNERGKYCDHFIIKLRWTQTHRYSSTNHKPRKP